MTPKDIIVGQKYKHPENPQTVYLGVGVDYQGPKYLLIIKDKTFKNTLVIPPEMYRIAHRDKKSLYNWWSKFYPI